MKNLEQEYGYLFEEKLLTEISTNGVYKKIKKGTTILDIGAPITHMPLLLNGAIKILREDEEGDELLLYFLEKGDACAMTFSGCFGNSNSKSKIRAVTENDTEIIMIPIRQIETWMQHYKSWQQFILDSYHNIMIELLETVDTLAFMRLDERLLRHLKDKAKVTNDDSIYSTHQDIAYDLHTSRVVISRLLKKLEKEGKILMNRNHIKILVF